MARKVEIVRPRALRDAIVTPPSTPSRSSSVALGLAMLLAAAVIGFALGFLAAHYWRSL